MGFEVGTSGIRLSSSNFPSVSSCSRLDPAGFSCDVLTTKLSQILPVVSLDFQCFEFISWVTVVLSVNFVTNCKIFGRKIVSGITHSSSSGSSSRRSSS